MFKKSKLILLLIALLPATAMTAQPEQTDQVVERANVEKKHKRICVCTF